jgi:CRP/FNR family cyclic AMP-dependent transcriptional regulator
MSVEPLEQLPFFQGLELDQIELLSALFIPWDCEADTVIFEQGELAEFLYVIVSGEIIVQFKPDDGPAILVARVQDGGVVGWSAALGSRTYTSAAMTTVDSSLLRVRGSDLRTLCGREAALGQIILDRLAGIIAERLRSTHAQVLALLEMGLRTSLHHQEVR